MLAKAGKYHKIPSHLVFMFSLTLESRPECVMVMQAVEPELNFKGHYDEEYRRVHPTAPRIVPWVSGVLQS